MGARKDEDKRMIKPFFSFFKSVLLGHVLKQVSIFTFGAWSFLFIHIQFTPSEGSKGFVNLFFKEIIPWISDHQVGLWIKGHLLWSSFNIMVYGPKVCGCHSVRFSCSHAHHQSNFHT